MDTIETSDVENVSEIHITPNAADRIQQLLSEKGLEGYALRVFISGGGCSGFQYGMAFEDQPREDDLHFSQDRIEVVIDPMSYGYLSGASIDYQDDLMGGGFSIDNPNAVATCGCGHSFRTTGDREDSPHHHHGAGGCNC